MKVEIKNLTKKYGQTVAVKSFSTELQDGQLICLLGPSGCGKSTILNMLCGIVPVTEGQIFFDGKDVTKLPPDQRNIGMVFQNYALYPHLTVAENIGFPLEVKKVSKQERLQKVQQMAELVQVTQLLKRYPSELSGGQQQRVAIARALIKSPQLLLMDEPLSNLDARLRLEMREEIRRIQQETGITTVFVTHDQEEAMSISDSILLLKDGSLIQSGLCQELYKNPNSQFVAEFLGNPPINKLQFDDENLKQIFPQNILDQISQKDITDLIFAIRPESFIFNGKMEAQVISFSEMGKEIITTLSFYGNTVRAILNTDDELHIGDKISVGLKNKGVFIFDKTNGQRLV